MSIRLPFRGFIKKVNEIIMRYEGQRPSGKDKDVPVYVFSFGKEELKMIMGALTASQKNLPHVIDLKPTRSRIANMRKALGKVLGLL